MHNSMGEAINHRNINELNTSHGVCTTEVSHSGRLDRFRGSGRRKED